ncbi:putative disease resistance RPP13-like protein 1 [Rhododendron vialii]|uniref:putative disease resistance RPP13-like protein 1 n=1 Tax=Rhododendron vialii TaxID=182163 RepID=UPI00265FD00B|nr:putative disease resistance RPP13-like protein 1 [Rhododendron vialii]
MVRDFFSTKNQAAFHFQMANKVNNINLLLEEVYNRANEIGLKPASDVHGVEHMEFRLTVPFIDDRVIVGREHDVSKVIEMLLASDVEDDELPVIAIVGMAGLGKTALAQLVYKQDKIVSNFGSERMWICVSDIFKVDRLLNEMVESLTKNKSDMQNVEAIVEKLGEKLNGKKYLLVLDDVWNRSETKWQCMRDSLLGIGGSKGSKVIVTTRDMDVVSTMKQTSPCHTHHLSGLSLDYSLTLFRKKAFANGGPIETQSLLVIGRRMLQRCEGVPLAINALGGVLQTKKYQSEWESIEKSGLCSALGDRNGILPVLRLSFDDLPSPSLKRCFGYCSVFPKDKIIIKDKLIQLWMALGYLQPPSRTNLEVEDIGNEYFNILLRRSLFQEVKLDEYNNIISCKMHDVVHDLAIEVFEGLPNVVEFPKEFHKLVNLRHFCMGESEVMPALIGDLTSLQTLNFFVVGVNKGHKIEELGRLSKLRAKLKICHLQRVKNEEEAKTANMMEKTDIQELVYHWANGDSMESHVDHEGVLEGLQPHKNLKRFVLEYFGGQRIASWMTSRDACFLQNLLTIKLKDCRQCEQVPTLGQLPYLEVVEINGLHNLKCIGSEFYGLDVSSNSSSSRAARAGDVFPALRKLTLDNIPKLEKC